MRRFRQATSFRWPRLGLVVAIIAAVFAVVIATATTSDGAPVTKKTAGFSGFLPNSAQQETR